MKNKIQGSLALKFRAGAVLFALCAVLLGPGWGVQRGLAQLFPPQGDDSTFSMGVFRITVDPAFRVLMDAGGTNVAYTGYQSAVGKLTSPLCIDNATTIGRSGPHARAYAFPVPIGLGSWDSIAGYGAYAAIPALWAGALPPTEEVLTEIKSFVLLSAGGGTAGKQCPPDPRIPTVPLNWPMVRAGTFAGVSPRSLGMVQENVVNGPASPDFPAHSFFDIFVEVSLPPLPGTESSVAFPGAGAILYNDSPLIITNLGLTGFPPEVVYIHGETTAVPLKFKFNNPPYWADGNIFGYLVLAGHGTLTVDCNNTNSYSTEMLQLDISGGGLPPGLMIRESPTLASTGGVAIQAQPDGSYAIDSFFDVFTELSTDGGGSSCPATNRHKVKLVCPTPPTNNFLPPTNCYYTNVTSRLVFTNCPLVILTNLVHRGWTTNFPPPTNNCETHTFNSVVDGQVSTDGGVTFNPFTAPAVCTIQICPGPFTSDAQSALLDAALGPIGNSAPEMAVEWLRPNTLCPSPGSTYDSVHGTNFDGTSIDVVKFVIPPDGPTIYTRNFVHSDFPNPIVPPPPNVTATYSAPNTLVTLEVSLDGNSWIPAEASGPLTVKISNTTGTGSTSTFDTEMLQLDLNGNSPFGPFRLRESPSRPSLGKHTIKSDPRGFRISSFFDVFLELSTDGGVNWTPADRSIRVQPSAPPAVPNSIFIKRSGPDVILDWLGDFALQSAPEVTGPYGTVYVGTGPYTNTPTAQRMFFRLSQ